MTVPITSDAFNQLVNAELDRGGLRGEGARGRAMLALRCAERCTLCGVLAGPPIDHQGTVCEECFEDPYRYRRGAAEGQPEAPMSYEARRLAFAVAYRDGTRTLRRLAKAARVAQETARTWRRLVNLVGLETWIGGAA